MPDSGSPVLSIRDLKTYYRQDEGIVRAVDGASFDLHRGRTLGIVGESGCGKSVTARSILRIVERGGRIESGSIMLRRPRGDGFSDEIDLTKLPSDGRAIRAIRGGEIALVFQEPMTSLSAFHTIGNQIGETIGLHSGLNRKDARGKAIEMLRLVGIPSAERRIDEYPFQLSGGLRQRVMIAMALAGDPYVLIADEPTTALDVTTQAQILDLLRRLQVERNLSIILITHDMGVIAEMADDVVIMYLGKVVEQGPVDEVFHAPRHPYTRSLLSSIPSILAEPRTRLTTISGAIPHPYNRPSGCAFHPRCSSRIDGVCDRREPVLLPVGNLSNARSGPAQPIQTVSCFLYDPVSDTSSLQDAIPAGSS